MWDLKGELHPAKLRHTRVVFEPSSIWDGVVVILFHLPNRQTHALLQGIPELDSATCTVRISEESGPSSGWGVGKERANSFISFLCVESLRMKRCRGPSSESWLSTPLSLCSLDVISFSRRQVEGNLRGLRRVFHPEIRPNVCAISP